MENKIEEEKQQQENLLEKYIENAAWIAGGLLFILGIVCLTYFISDYNGRCITGMDKSTWFDNNSKAQDLATVILGSTGLFWGLAGTVFFVYTIRQTKIEIKQQIDEMQQTNNSLISQRTQTTFFNLLDNHKKTIEALEVGDHKGTDALKYIKNSFTEGLQSFEPQYYNAKFSNHTVTAKHPYCIYNRHQVIIEYYITNFITILNFIDTKITDEKDFHFKLLYNQLSLNEKYIIGMYANVANTPNEEIILQHKDVFLNHYYSEKHNFRYELKMYFPEIQIYSILNNNGRTVSDNFAEDEKNFEFRITLKSLLYNVGVPSLEKVILKIDDNKEIELSYKYKLELGTPKTINLHDEISKYFTEEYNRFECTYNIYLKFVLLYNGYPYTINNKIQVSTSYTPNIRFETIVQGITPN